MDSSSGSLSQVRFDVPAAAICWASYRLPMQLVSPMILLSCIDNCLAATRSGALCANAYIPRVRVIFSLTPDLLVCRTSTVNPLRGLNTPRKPK